MSEWVRPASDPELARQAEAGGFHLAMGRENQEAVTKTANWSVTIEGRAAKTLDPEDVVEQLAEHAATVSYADGLLSTTATVGAGSVAAAIDYLYERLSEAVGRIVVEYAEAMTEERQARELGISNLPDLVGIAEIAELAKTSRQRVFQMTANKGFPAALLQLRSGRLWSRPAIERYLERHPVGQRRLKNLGSQVGGRSSVALQRKKEHSHA